MAVSTKRKNSLKSKSNSKTRKQFKKFRKTKKNVIKMKGGNQLNVYSFKVCVDVNEDSYTFNHRAYSPIYEYRIVYAKDKNEARGFIKDYTKNGYYIYKGNINGLVYGEDDYDASNNFVIISIKDSIILDTFLRNIKKLGTAPQDSNKGIVDLSFQDAKEEPDVNNELNVNNNNSLL